MTGRSQAVRLPLEFRFSKAEVYINRNELTGDVVLSTRPNTWDAFFAIDGRVPSNFLSEDERAQGEHRCTVTSSLDESELTDLIDEAVQWAREH